VLRKVAPEETPATKNVAVVPGESIGNINLGAGSGEIANLLGKPTVTYERGVGMKEVVWYSPIKPGSELTDEIHVLYSSDVAIQIKVTAPEYTVPGGFTTGLKLAQAVQQFKNLKLTAFDMTTEGESGYAAYYYDDVDKGLAFEIDTQDYFDHSIAVDALILHRPGYPVKPDKGASPIKPTANQPLKPEPPPKRKAYGNGLPIEERYDDNGVYSWASRIIETKSGINFWATADIGEQGRSYIHPLTHIIVATQQPSAVWQDADSVTLGFGRRRIRLAALKGTSATAEGKTTILVARVPYAIFAQLANYKRLFIEVSGNSFEIPESQTVGIRQLATALARR
jgi:hypothetical protein